MRHLIAFAFLLHLVACSSTRRSERFFQNNIKAEIENSPVFKYAFTGFNLIDASTGKELCAVQADRYFTPASNTKILTLATSLAVLGDSLPRFRYDYVGPDSSEPEGLYIMTGTGDPTTLHPAFQHWQTLPDFYLAHPFAPRYFFQTEGSKSWERYGNGWMWDDFPTYYSAEVSSLPVYGNTLRICWDGIGWLVSPEKFQTDLVVDESIPAIEREPFSHRIHVQPFPGFQPDTCFEIPMFNPNAYAQHLLLDSLPFAEQPQVNDPEVPLKYLKQYWSATPVDTVYRRLMQQSDNFIAEQLLLVCAGVKFDTLHSKKIINWAKDSLFAGLPNPPRWVDGSGLSRYNLISPAFLTGLLRKLYLEQPRERLFSLFPAGGASGTIQDWYAGPDGKPFVFAKTGSMSGVHCLSGYLLTKRGRVLIFSFMHNNFIGSNKAWKQEMQRLLLEIYLRG